MGYSLGEEVGRVRRDEGVEIEMNGKLKFSGTTFDRLRDGKGWIRVQLGR